MRQHAARFFGWGAFVLLSAVFIFGCATAPTPTPAKDIASIAGKWEGWGVHSNTGRLFFTWTIRPEGGWQMITDLPMHGLGREFTGKAYVEEGKVEFDCSTPELSGTGTLQYRGDARWLLFTSNDGAIRAELRRAL